MLRRAMLADVGVYNPDLFAYCEDTDLALRAQLKGWRCRFVPAAVVYHKYSACNAPLLSRQGFPGRTQPGLGCRQVPAGVDAGNHPTVHCHATGRASVGRPHQTRRRRQVRRAESRTQLLGILFRAWAAALRGLPSALRKRRGIQRARRISALDAWRWLRLYRMGVGEIALRD